MAINDYQFRMCDRELKELLKSSGAVLIEGAKWCGKTSTAKQAANSILYMQDPDNAASYKQMADTKPSVLLAGETPRLLDEWQMAPVLWDAVRFEVDKRSETGQFILTGSSVPTDGATAHTGTGRIARMQMRPMSLFESNDSNGTVSLRKLFDGDEKVENISNLTIEQIAFLICRGGWPAAAAATNLSPKAALHTATNYAEAIINTDIHRVDGVERNPERVRLMLRSLARNISTLATAQTIIDDVAANDISMSEKTYTSYINALQRMFVVEDSPAWQPSLRSKTAIRTSSKRHFVDPSIAAAVMRIKPENILNDFNTFGLLFESLCTRDMRVYAQAKDGSIFHYRDKLGLEADIVVRLNDGRWAAVEVKLGNKQIEEASANLIKLRNRIDTDKTGEPSFLMVLTGGQYAYRNKEGVYIVPIGCLKD
jgi:predicted AAA+ superfamily ATPase